MNNHGCSIFLGNTDLPAHNNQPIKISVGTYEFGANLVSSKACAIVPSSILHPYCEAEASFHVRAKNQEMHHLQR